MMVRRWLTIAVVASAVVAISEQAATATSAQVAKFKSVDATYAKADHSWTSALESLSANASPSQLSKPSLVYVPAIKTFDSAISSIGFSGKTATDIATVVKLNGKLITDLSSIKSTKTFISEFSALDASYMTVQASLAKDLGIPAADVQV